MNIAICGPDGCGKTSLANHLAGTLGLPLIPDLYRETVQELQCQTFFLVPDKLDFFRRILQRLEELQQSMDRFIIDRSALDYWVIWQRWCWNHYPPATTTRLQNRLNALQEQYQKTIVLPVNLQSEYDGFRFINRDYAGQYEALLHAYIHQSPPPERYMVVQPATSIENLIEHVEADLHSES